MLLLKLVKAEKSQLGAQNFINANSRLPCYVKMGEMPAPRKIERVHDLVAQCAILFTVFTCDWIADEYFADHDNDYLVSSLCLLYIHTYVSSEWCAHGKCATLVYPVRMWLNHLKQIEINKKAPLVLPSWGHSFAFWSVEVLLWSIHCFCYQQMDSESV